MVEENFEFWSSEISQNKISLMRFLEYYYNPSTWWEDFTPVFVANLDWKICWLFEWNNLQMALSPTWNPQKVHRETGVLCVDKVVILNQFSGRGWRVGDEKDYN